MLHVLTADRTRIIYQTPELAANARKVVEQLGWVCALDGTYLPRCDREQYNNGNRPDRALKFA